MLANGDAASPDEGAEGDRLCGVDFDAMRLAIDARLSECIAAPDASPRQLNNAIRYSLLAPGKRIRPMLAMVAAAQFGADSRRSLDLGCAVEMVHTASLVLDDLPCMDNAGLRRGQATTHRVYGEDMAVLAAVTLMNRAYGLIASMDHLDPLLRMELVRLIEQAIGTNGLVAGQARDLHERTGIDCAGSIEQINFEKTGVLFILAVEAGARVAGVTDVHRLNQLQAFAQHLGLAFQTLDDVLDQSASAVNAGKDVRKDGQRLTAVSINGLQGAEALARKHLAFALDAMSTCSSEQPLLQTFVETLFAPVKTA